MITMKPTTLTLTTGIDVIFTGYDHDESGEVLVELADDTLEILSLICGFEIVRSFLVVNATDDYTAHLYVERTGAADVPIYADSDEYYRIFDFRNQLEAYGLGMMLLDLTT